MRLVCRILVGATFVFSGFVKAVDPWGFAIKIGEYLASFGLGWMDGMAFFLSILLSGMELLLGLMLLCGVRRREASLLVFVAMIFFTLLTLGVAIWSPVEDCGCFGDAVRLSNWGTFFKNLVLLPMAWVVFAGSRPGGRWVWVLPLAMVSFGVGIYSYRHLPPIDFLPYRLGVDLREEPVERSVEATVVVRDRVSGKRRRFAVSDTAWYDAEKWEYLKTHGGRARVEATTRDFAVFDAGGVPVTDSILNYGGEVFMVCVGDIERLGASCVRRLERGVEAARRRGAWVLWLDGREYGMDATTLKTMLRAHAGVVVLRGGVIVDKKNCRDM